MKELINNLLSFLIYFCILGLPVSLYAEVNEITVTGYAAIDDDKIKARKIALEDAKRQAVEQGLGLFIESKTTSENFALSRDEILTRTTGRLSGYKIIKEETEADNTIAITITATLSAKNTHKQIQDVINELGLSRLPNLNIEVEAQGDADRYVGKIRSALVKKVKRNGFLVKNSNKEMNSGGFTVLVNLKLDEESTDYQGIAITRATANVELTATRLSDSVVLATESGSYQKAGGNTEKTIKGYVDKKLDAAWKSMQRQLLAHWYNEQQSGRNIIIKLKSPDPTALSKLVNTLSSKVFGISGAKLLMVDGNYGTIEVVYFGWPEQLYSQLNQTEIFNQSYQLNTLKNDEIIMQLSNQS